MESERNQEKIQQLQEQKNQETRHLLESHPGPPKSSIITACESSLAFYEGAFSLFFQKIKAILAGPPIDSPRASALSAGSGVVMVNFNIETISRPQEEKDYIFDSICRRIANQIFEDRGFWFGNILYKKRSGAYSDEYTLYLIPA